MTIIDEYNITFNSHSRIKQNTIAVVPGFFVRNAKVCLRAIEHIDRTNGFGLFFAVLVDIGDGLRVRLLRGEADGESYVAAVGRHGECGGGAGDSHGDAFAADADAARTLAIADREGSFPGMLETRKFNIVLVTPDNGRSFTRPVKGVEVEYDGKAVTVNL